MDTTGLTRDLSVAAVAVECGTTKHRVYEAIRSGRLRAYALTTNTTRVTRRDLDEFKATGGVLAAPAEPTTAAR